MFIVVFSNYSKLTLSLMISTSINKRKQSKLTINTTSFCISDALVRTFFFPWQYKASIITTLQENKSSLTPV